MAPISVKLVSLKGVHTFQIRFSRFVYSIYEGKDCQWISRGL